MLLPLAGYDLGDPETVSEIVGYLLQFSVACRVVFCLIKITGGLTRTCYLASISYTLSQTFGTTDVDQDGRIDRQEWIAHFGDDTGFDLHDFGHDGSISHAEFLAYQSSLLRTSTVELDDQHHSLADRSRTFGTTDIDQDGRIDRQEWIAYFGDDIGFDAHDAGNDGSISRAEFLAYAAA